MIFRVLEIVIFSRIRLIFNLNDNFAPIMEIIKQKILQVRKHRSLKALLKCYDKNVK